jgi:hypothetical protein
MEALFFQAIAAADTDAADRVYGRGMLGRDGVTAEPDRPYIQVGWDPITPTPGFRDEPGLARSGFTVMVYDEPTSFSRIKEIHRIVRDTVLALVGTRDERGVQCTGVEWTGQGGEAYDPVSRCNVIPATYRITARF